MLGATLVGQDVSRRSSHQFSDHDKSHALLRLAKTVATPTWASALAMDVYICFNR